MCHIFQKLNSEIWTTNECQFTIQEYETFLNMVLESEVSSVSIVENQPQQILSLMPIPQFNNLRELIINRNNINNVEALQFINAPFLSIIMLRENHITSLHVFRKINMDQLQFFSLSWNMIRSSEQLKAFGRFVTNKKKQNSLNLEGYLYDAYQSYSWFAYEEAKEVWMENTEEQNQNFYLLTKNMLYFRPNLTDEMSKRIAHIPFLAKAINSPDQKKDSRSYTEKIFEFYQLFLLNKIFSFNIKITSVEYLYLSWQNVLRKWEIEPS